MTEQNTALVRRAVEEIWNGGDLALAEVLFASTYVNHGGLIPDLVRGPEAITSGVTLYRTAFPTFHLTVEALVAEGAVVELAWAARSTPDRRARDARASAPGTLRGTTRSRLAGGQIAESWTTWDRAGVLRSLGIIPAEEGPGPAPPPRPTGPPQEDAPGGAAPPPPRTPSHRASRGGRTT